MQIANGTKFTKFTKFTKIYKIYKGEVVGLTIEDFSKVLPHLNDCSEYILMENFDFMIEVLNGASHLAKG